MTPTAIRNTTTGLVLACIILPVPIVLGYGVRAAAREERNPPGHR